MEIFKKNFEICEEKRVNYTIDVSDENLSHLLKMTPLMWNVPDKSKFNKNEITVDVTIVSGTKK